MRANPVGGGRVQESTPGGFDGVGGRKRFLRMLAVMLQNRHVQRKLNVWYQGHERNTRHIGA